MPRPHAHLRALDPGERPVPSARGVGQQILTALTVVAIDQAAKTIAPHVSASVVLPARNHGVLTGALAGPGVALAILTIVVLGSFIAIVGRWAVQVGVSPLIPAVIAGGMAAQAVDRVLYGAVRDFLSTGWLIIDVADFAVAGGLVALVLGFALRMRALRRADRTIALDRSTLRAVIVDRRAA